MEYTVCSSRMLLIALMVLSSSVLEHRVQCNTVTYNTDEKSCENLEAHIRRETSAVKVEMPPRLKGQWVSQRCEIRPGPEYVIRHYKFLNNTSFIAYQYYYEDADCTTPLYSMTITGGLPPMVESWTIPGAFEVNQYTMSSITLTPYDAEITRKLEQLVNETCPDFANTHGTWRPYNQYDVYRYLELDPDNVLLDRDCIDPLDFSMHEMNIARVETRQSRHSYRRELLLGDIHTDKEMRFQHRPKSFQPPLMDVTSDGCHLCNKLLRSTVFDPPVLHKKTHVTVPLGGSWISTHCEVTPNAMFLKRRLVFNNEKNSLTGFYDYFADPQCVKRTFSFKGDGKYMRGSESDVLKNTDNYRFEVNNLKLTLHDQTYVQDLNSRPKGTCGIGADWKVGVEKDVTVTGGCKAYGLRVPHVEYDVVHLAKYHKNVYLYLGQRPSDGTDPASPAERPTSFQQPLLGCGDVDVKFLYETGYRKNKATFNHPGSLILVCLSFLAAVLTEMFVIS